MTVRRGFTLIELLVVVVIAGVLAAMRVPAVLGGLRLAEETACASNLRQLGLAVVCKEVFIVRRLQEILVGPGSRCPAGRLFDAGTQGRRRPVGWGGRHRRDHSHEQMPVVAHPVERPAEQVVQPNPGQGPRLSRGGVGDPERDALGNVVSKGKVPAVVRPQRCSDPQVVRRGNRDGRPVLNP